MNENQSVRKRLIWSDVMQETVAKRHEQIITSDNKNDFYYHSKGNRLTNWSKEIPSHFVDSIIQNYERTDYTYGDSGSYRSDRLDAKWRTPDMSRLPLQSSVENNSPQQSDSHRFSPMDYNVNKSNLREFSVIATKLGTLPKEKYMSQSVDLDNESSGSSKYSNLSNSRVLRSITRNSKVRNAIPQTHRLSEHQYDTDNDYGNSDTNSLHTADTNVITVQSGRHKNNRKSFRSTTPPRVSSTSISQNRTVTDENLSPNLSTNRISSTMSTYVYTTVPIRSKMPELTQTSPTVSGDGPGQSYGLIGKTIASLWSHISTNGKHTVVPSSPNVYRTVGHSSKSKSNAGNSGWLAPHIFGLERSTAKRCSSDINNTSQFLASDVEDTNDNGTTSSRRSKRKHPRVSTHLNDVQTKTKTSSFMNYLYYVHTNLYKLSIQVLALLLTFLYTCGSLTNHYLRRFSQWLLARFNYTGNNTSSYNGLSSSSSTMNSQQNSNFRKLRARTRHDSTHTNYRTIVDETDYDNNLFESSTSCCCCRFLLFMCILIPFLLLLVYLLTQLGLVNSSILPSDYQCKSYVNDIDLLNKSRLHFFGWRIKCLYKYYKIAFNEAQNKFAENWTQWWYDWWFPRRSSKLTDSTIGSRSIVEQSDNQYRQDSSSTKCMNNELATLAQSINERMDILSRNLKSTDERLDLQTKRFTVQYDQINLQLTELLHQFTAHLNTWNEFKLNRASILGQYPVHDIVDKEYILSAAIDAANRTIWTQLNFIRDSLFKNDDVINKLVIENEDELKDKDSLSQLFILLVRIHNQFAIRMKQNDDELLKLRLELSSKLNEQTQNQASSDRNMAEFHIILDKLIKRLDNLEKFNAQTELAFADIKEGLGKLEGDEIRLQAEQRNITEYIDTVLSKLSQTLTDQINTATHEILMKKMDDLSLSESAFISKLEDKISILTKNIVNKFISEHKVTLLSHSSGTDVASLKLLIEEALEKFAADRTGLADFALESAGATIVGTRCTKTYTEGASVISLFGLPLAHLSNSPRTILQPGNNPGDCWAFHGSSGQAVIRLSAPIIISAVTLEHLPRQLAPNGHLDSAPREFLIKALSSEYDDKGTVLGTFVYDINGKPIQTFLINNYKDPVQFVEFAVLNNNGHPSYTCVYRLRVHGTMHL